MERSKQIERNLKEDGIQAAKDIKLLLLGKTYHLTSSTPFCDLNYNPNLLKQAWHHLTSAHLDLAAILHTLCCLSSPLISMQ